MGIDNIDELKPPEFTLTGVGDPSSLPVTRVIHNPLTCGGQGICLTCSVRAYMEKTGPET